MNGRRTLAALFSASLLLGAFTVSAGADAGSIGSVTLSRGTTLTVGQTTTISNANVGSDGLCYADSGRTARVKVYTVDANGLHADPPLAVVSATAVDGRWSLQWTPPGPGKYLLKPLCDNPDGYYDRVTVTVNGPTTGGPTTGGPTTGPDECDEIDTSVSGSGSGAASGSDDCDDTTEVAGVTTTIPTSGPTSEPTSVLGVAGPASGATPTASGAVAYTG